MTRLYIENTEDQIVYATINGQSFNFHIFAFRNLMYVDIQAGGEVITYAKRLLPNQWILPNYIAEGIGNIRFEAYVSDENDYIWYEDFNTKFRLVTYLDDEIKSLESP